MRVSSVCATTLGVDTRCSAHTPESCWLQQHHSTVFMYEEGARRHAAVCSGCDHILHKINAERIEREQEKQKRREQWKRKWSTRLNQFQNAICIQKRHSLWKITEPKRFKQELRHNRSRRGSRFKEVHSLPTIREIWKPPKREKSIQTIAKQTNKPKTTPIRHPNPGAHHQIQFLNSTGFHSSTYRVLSLKPLLTSHRGLSQVLKATLESVLTVNDHKPLSTDKASQLSKQHGFNRVQNGKTVCPQLLDMEDSCHVPSYVQRLVGLCRRVKE